MINNMVPKRVSNIDGRGCYTNIATPAQQLHGYVLEFP